MHVSSKSLQDVNGLGFITNKKYVLDDFFYLSSCQEYFVCLFTCLVLKKVPFFYLIRVDVCVLYQKQTYGGKKYLLTLVDDYSRVTWIYLIFNKYDVMVALKQIVAFVNNQFNTCVNTYILDNGDDFFQ